MTDFKCEIRGLIGATRRWSMGMHLTGGVSEAALAATFNAAASALFTTATDGIQHLVTSDVTTTDTVVRTLNVTMKTLSKTTSALALTGDGSGQSLPWKDSCVVEMYSSILNQKRARGSFYLPPFAQSQLAADVYISANQESLQDVLDVFFPAIHTSGVQSFSFNSKPLKDGTPAFTKTILDKYRVSDKPTSQKGRTRKIIPTYTIGTAF